MNQEPNSHLSCTDLHRFWRAAILCNDAREIISPLINWQDRKYSNKKVVKKMRQIVGDTGYDDVGIDFASGITGAILFGIKENQPDLFAKIKNFVLPTDFIRGKLLGMLDYSTDTTNAFSTGLFNTRESKWHEGIIQKLSLPLDIFPKVRFTSDIAGYLSRDIANMLGLEEKIPIIFGGGDNQMSMLGSGLISETSPLLINIGTAAQISMVVSDYNKIPGVDTRSYFNDLFAFVKASLAGGRSYKWLKEDIQEEYPNVTYIEMDELASDIRPGADGLVFCPGPSRNNPERKMGFYGNNLDEYGLGHKARAVMEGVLFDLFESYQELRIFNSNPTMVGAGKGLQRSKIWSQIAADIFSKPIRITNFENALFGATIMAAIGSGRLSEMSDAISSIEYDDQIFPNKKNTIQYQSDVVKNWKSIVNKV